MCAGLESSPALTCGSPANSKLACTFVLIFIILLKLLCQTYQLGIDVGTFSACLSATYFPSSFGVVFEGIMNGLVLGAEWTQEVCPGIEATGFGFIAANCPGSFDSLTAILNILFPTG